MDKIRRTCFVFYKDWLNTINELPQEIQFDIYKAIAEYGINGNIPELKPVAKAVFSLVKQTIDRDCGKHEDKSLSGRIGNLKRWHKDLYDGYKKGIMSIGEAENVAKHRTVSQSIAPDGEIANVNVNVNNNVNNNNNVNVKKSAREFFFISNQRIDESLKSYVERTKSYFIQSFLTSNLLASIFDEKKFFELLTQRYPNGSSFSSNQHLDSAIKKIITDNFKKRETKMVY